MENTIKQFVEAKEIPKMGVCQAKRWAYSYVDKMIKQGILTEEQKIQAREIACEIVIEAAMSNDVEEERKAFHKRNVYKPWENK